MTNLLRDEDPSLPCEPPSAPVLRSTPFERETTDVPLPGYVVVPIPDVNSRPEHVSSVLRRIMGELQDVSDGAPGETREHLNAAWKELRKAVVSLPAGKVSER